MIRHRARSHMLCMITAVVLLLSVCGGVVHAQPWAADRYRYYQPRDTVFRLVGTNIGHLSIARDELLLDYVRQYNRVDPDTLRRLFHNPLDTFEKKKREFYSDALAAGYGVIVPVEGVGPELKFTRVIENYARVDPNYFHNLHFSYVNLAGGVRAGRYGLDSGVVVGALGTPSDTMIVSGPTYNATYAFHRGDPDLYMQARPNLPDRSTYMRVSFAVRADELDDPTNPVPDAALLAYAVLYRRVRRNQEACKCMVYEPFDTIKITKEFYLTSAFAVDSLTGYRDLGKTINFAYAKVARNRDSTVITRNSLGQEISTSTHYFYNPDTVVGWVYKTNDVYHATVPDLTQIPPGTHEILVRRDSIELQHVPLHKLNPEPWLIGDGMSWFGYANCSDSICDIRVANGDFGPGVIRDYMDASDFSVRFYSTRRVPITFLRLRINQDMYDQLRDGRLDTMMQVGMHRLYQNDTLRRLLGRLPYSDETTFHKFRSDGAVARKLQDFMRQEGDTVRQLWCNPVSNFAAFRVQSEDLDTSRIKTLQLIVRQDYVQIGGPGEKDPIPIRYVNPDSMSWFGTNQIYRPVVGVSTTGDSIRYEMICPHADTAYAFYNTLRQNGFGNFMDSKTILARGQGPTVTTLARLVDVAKFRYRQYGPTTPVWNTIQDMGWRITTNTPSTDGLGRAYLPWSSRPPTAEEITAQSWLSLNCGVDGLVYTDMQIDAPNFGFVHPLAGKLTREYDSLLPANTSHLYTYADSLRWKQPLMWTGFVSRFEAVKRMNQEIRHLDSLIHLSELVFRQEQMSVHDTRQSFATMPLLDTAMAEQAKRFTRGGGGAFIGSDTLDARGQTYLEITHFLPGPRDTSRSGHYLLITNRRCWPVDTITYGAVAQSHGARANGLGAIDVRRPVIVLKNTTTMMSDSFIIEKVGHESEWPSRTVAAGARIPLDWLRPGWGAYYRITPVPSGVSEHGTAYNNAVRGENPSTNTTAKDRIVVYERDSSVYLRAMDSNGRWGGELLVSDATDTNRVSSLGRRRAHNIFPAFATIRNGTSCAVVWERRDTANRASVEVRWIAALPKRTSTVLGSSVRRQLSDLKLLRDSSMQLAPSIVGLDSGYLFAWAGHDFTIETKAMRDNPSLSGKTTARYDTSRTMRLRMKAMPPQTIDPDSIAAYPTLAYVSNYDAVRLNGGQISGTAADSSWSTLPSGGADTFGIYHVAHLAYQQGDRPNNGWQIYYNRVGVRFLPLPGTLPELWVSETEDVSVNLPGCEFIHPSIAADSARVGVAFTTNWKGSLTTLRFRNPDAGPRRRWQTTAYRWGGRDTTVTTPGGYRQYTRPSLVMFPSRSKEDVDTDYEGGLVWQWENAPGGRDYRQIFYRFGELVTDTLPDGKHPTMLGVPYKGTSPGDAFRATGVFHRGSETEWFQRPRGWGEYGSYYPGYLENTPSNPIDRFQVASGSTSQIHGSYSIHKLLDVRAGSCDRPSIDVGITTKIPPTTRRNDDPDLPFGPPITPPPSGPPFGPPFPPPPITPPPGPPRIVTHPTMGMNIARTGTFITADSSVTVTRTIAGSDSLVAWLNTQPWDSSTAWPMPVPANIFITTQLVRASDSSILWRSDTISARNVGADTLIDDGLSGGIAWNGGVYSRGCCDLGKSSV